MKTVSFQSFVGSQFGIFVFAIIIIICGFILYTTKPDGFGTNRFCGGSWHFKWNYNFISCNLLSFYFFIVKGNHTKQ